MSSTINPADASGSYDPFAYLYSGGTGTAGQQTDGNATTYDPQDIVDSSVSSLGNEFNVENFLKLFDAQQMQELQGIFAFLSKEMQQFISANGTQGTGPMPTEGVGTPTTGADGEPPVPKGGGRPPGDNRTAEEILAQAKGDVANRLGNQKDIRQDLLKGKDRCGDWTANNPDPEARADAAYNLVEVLEYIDSSKSADGRDRGEAAGNGNIEGITKDGDARRGTEAGKLKDFAEQGYGVFDGSHRLDATKDTHVRWDGTNKDDFQWFVGEVGRTFHFIPGLSNMLMGIGESKGGVGGMILGGLQGVVQTWEGVGQGVMEGLMTGNFNPLALAASAYMGAADVSYNNAYGGSNQGKPLFGGDSGG